MKKNISFSAEAPLQILVRLPNWLGDVIMSFGFLKTLHVQFPNSCIDVIIKKGLEDVLIAVPEIHSVFTFQKHTQGSLGKLWQYGKQLKPKSYDLFFCLPLSFSSAYMGWASGAKYRIGYKAELRSVFFTHAYSKPKNLHRVEEYAMLVFYFLNKPPAFPTTYTFPSFKKESVQPYVVLHLHSEAISRALPVKACVQLVQMLQKRFPWNIKLSGSVADASRSEEIIHLLPPENQNNIEVLAGKTNLLQLITLMQQAALVVSVDSGPAHIAAACNVPLVVIFGAGNEKNTGPYYAKNAYVVRHGELPCEPCVKNTCKWQTLPLCLEQLNLNKIIRACEQALEQDKI